MSKFRPMALKRTSSGILVPKLPPGGGWTKEDEEALNEAGQSESAGPSPHFPPCSAKLGQCTPCAKWRIAARRGLSVPELLGSVDWTGERSVL